MSFFDFLNAINTTKKNLLKEDPLSEKDYVPFMVNRGLSYFSDTIMYANEMNKYASAPKNWQFDFYLHAVPSKKRFSKWTKKEASSEDVKLVMKAYDYSTQKAMQALEMLTSDQLENLRISHNRGGR